MGGDVIGEINYLTSTTDGDAPWLVVSSEPAEQRSNLAQMFIPVTIHDLRGKEKNVNLDMNGFEVINYNGNIQKEFEEDSKEQQIYYEEMTELLKKHLGASRVFIYHYGFRSRSKLFTDEQCDYHHRNPVFYPHIDTDSAGVKEAIGKLFNKEEAEKLMQNRIQVMNIWRPLGSNPITQKPLTICDYRSLDINKDIHSLALRGQTYHSTACTLSCHTQNTHKWYYLDAMQSNEMFAFKMFDSKPDVAQCAFHTAFTNTNAPTSNEEQKSIEIRCFIFYDEP